ncbi:hypothetical protein [Collimonas arenae]|uniref:hypothetical protein n=1 Tax=Collimonas arenae TaxID=279058 RepID=UPI0012E89DD6|nr:hypothetical protein [Collimonas arenae]
MFERSEFVSHPTGTRRIWQRQHARSQKQQHVKNNHNRNFNFNTNFKINFNSLVAFYR